ncbi:uncharacterized protein LOC143002638 isoform X2 [Genypterus blacodes]|uniref:uncharacterized protein LOC143002638 isoform X2 n=1 Tax=Genypterus blacodes TaxID=154954 RepID=UPI003F768033
MVNSILTSYLGFVLMAVAHMVLKGQSRAEVTGFLGENITLEFTFEKVTLNNDSYFALYTNNTQKISECRQEKSCSQRHPCAVDAKHTKASVQYCITNLSLNHSKFYWASVSTNSGPMTESNKVRLIVREEERTAPPAPTVTTAAEVSESPSFFSFYVLIVLAALSAALFAGLLPVFIWSLKRAKEHKQQQQQQQQQSPSVTAQETPEASKNVCTPSLVYSVLDFPKRHQAGAEIQPAGTEYASISYLPEQTYYGV